MTVKESVFGTHDASEIIQRVRKADRLLMDGDKHSAITYMMQVVAYTAGMAGRTGDPKMDQMLKKIADLAADTNQRNNMMLRAKQGVSMNDDNLRSRLIHLANENPEVREHLLPILKEGQGKPKMDTHSWNGARERKRP